MHVLHCMLLLQSTYYPPTCIISPSPSSPTCNSTHQLGYVAKGHGTKNKDERQGQEQGARRQQVGASAARPLASATNASSAPFRIPRWLAWYGRTSQSVYLYSSTEVSERVALQQRRLHVWVGVCYIPLRIQVRPPPSTKSSYGLRPWAYNTYSTVHVYMASYVTNRLAACK